MSTYGHFYTGKNFRIENERGKADDVKFIGGIKWDGYAEGIPAHILLARSEQEFVLEVRAYSGNFSARDGFWDYHAYWGKDATIPDTFWWENYIFDTDASEVIMIRSDDDDEDEVITGTAFNFLNDAARIVEGRCPRYPMEQWVDWMIETYGLKYVSSLYCLYHLDPQYGGSKSSLRTWLRFRKQDGYKGCEDYFYAHKYLDAEHIIEMLQEDSPEKLKLRALVHSYLQDFKSCVAA